MERFSLSRLSAMTGFDRRTVNLRLEGQKGEKKGNAMTFTVRQLIDGITDKLKAEADVLNLEQERARLALEHRRKLEDERRLRERELLPADDVLSVWSSVIVELRSKILNTELDEDTKAELIEDLRAIEIDGYES